MNCIDAIEGIVKTIVDCTLEDLASDNLDDTLFIHSVKTAITATLTFLNKNIEVSDNPDLVKRIIYDYAKEKWITHWAAREKRDPQMVEEGNTISVDRAYLDYYYDYIYDRGVYPPWNDLPLILGPRFTLEKKNGWIEWSKYW